MTTGLPGAASDAVEEGSSLLDRIRVAFLDEASAIGNPLDPVTPMRLAFLIRGVLLDLSGGRVPEAEVYTAVWERRAELAGRTAAGLDGYRTAADVFARTRGACEAARSAASSLIVMSLIVAAGAAGYAGLGGHLPAVLAVQAAQGTAVTTRLTLLAAAASLLLGIMVSGLTRSRRARAGRRYYAAYARFVQGGLVTEIAALVMQIIQLKDEQVSGVLLSPVAAPSLVEFRVPAVIQSESIREVLALVNGHVTSAVGVVGARGAGKSTLLRLLCGSDHPGSRVLSHVGAYLAARDQAGPGRSARVGVFLAAPASPAEGEFVKVLYATTVRKVLASRNVSAGGLRGWRQRLGVLPADDVALAQEALDQISGATSRSRSNALSLSRLGVAASLGGQRTWTERDLSHADWVAEFRNYLERHYLRGGPPILIAIDELDKIPDAGQAVEIINSLKDLFHIEGVHFVISVSDDALRSFATRGIPVRDSFDSAFDAVVEIPRITAAESCELLRTRVRYFPYTAALFCHAWSGGLPRDLIRAGRSCVALLNRAGSPIPIADLARTIIRRDLIQFTDAAIRRQDADAAGDIESLLALRRQLSDQPADQQFACAQASAPQHYNDPVLSSLDPFLGIASAISEYFSIPRSPQQWADGIKTGEFLHAADLLAQARAALAIHPLEAEWRLQRARNQLGLTSTGTDQAS
jgi:energy-coupling factor transporter ATP-binding protein EcfA2